MKILSFLLGALVLSASIGSKALSHPHHHGTSAVPVVAPVSLIPLQAEEIMGFEYSGQYYTVVNTHQRGLFGVELIEIHNSQGLPVAGWWTTRGWCFTHPAYTSNACFSDAGFVRFMQRKMVSSSYTRSAALYSGGGAAVAEETDFCEHYSKLEYKISGDTSGRCDY